MNDFGHPDSCVLSAGMFIICIINCFGSASLQASTSGKDLYQKIFTIFEQDCTPKDFLKLFKEHKIKHPNEMNFSDTPYGNSLTAKTRRECLTLICL